MLLDTGSEICGVKQSFLKEQYYTGEHITCRTFAGNIEKYKVAWANIVTPSLTKRIKCTVNLNPTSDIIIEALPDVAQRDEQTIQQWVQDNIHINTANQCIRDETNSSIQSEINTCNKTASVNSCTLQQDNNKISHISNCNQAHALSRLQTRLHKEKQLQSSELNEKSKDIKVEENTDQKR